MYKFLIAILVINLSFGCSSQANSAEMSETSIYEIYLCLGTAIAGQHNKLGYPAGERHAILVFLRQPTNTQPDWEQARSYVEGVGWNKVDLQKASKIDPKTLDESPEGKKSYDEAMSNGKAMIVYSEPVKDEE